MLLDPTRFPERVNWEAARRWAERVDKSVRDWEKHGGQWKEFDYPRKDMGPKAKAVYDRAFTLLRVLMRAELPAYTPHRSRVALGVTLAECILDKQ